MLEPVTAKNIPSANTASREFLTGMRQAKKPTGPLLALVINLVFMGLAGSLPLLFGIGESNTGSFAGQLIMTSSFAIWIAGIFAWVVYKEKRSIKSLGFGGKSSTEILYGALAGFALTTLVVFINVVSGTATLGQFSVAAIIPVLILLIGFSIQASAEEIAYRGYLVQAFSQRFAIAVVVILQAVLFTLGHLGNGLNWRGVLAMLAVSYLLIMWILARGNLWAAMAFHAAWNWSQANLWGANVSNIKMDTHVFAFTPSSGSELLSGGNFGLEGSLLTSALLIAGGVYFHLQWRKARA